MSTLPEDLQKQVRLLTSQEKAELVKMLLSELEPFDNAEVEQLWSEEAQRRYAAYLSGEIEALPGKEVMARVRSRMKM